MTEPLSPNLDAAIAAAGEAIMIRFEELTDSWLREPTGEELGRVAVMAALPHLGKIATDE